MLKALVDGIPLVACDQVEDRWIELQREQRAARKAGARLIVCPGCGGPMHTRKLSAPYLTQTFVHDPTVAARCMLQAGIGESAEHVGLKAAVYKTVQATKGWLADVEAPFGDGAVVVDVLATKLTDRTKDGRQGFEVQLSSETAGAIIDRQERRTTYLAQNTWIVRTPQPWDRKVPTYRVERQAAGDELVVDGVVRWSGGLDGDFVPADPMPIDRLTKLILRDRMVFVEGFGLIDRTEESRRPKRGIRVCPGAGPYVTEHCDRPRLSDRPQQLPARDLRGLTPKVEGIIAELDRHYFEHPEQWPADSDRARRFGLGDAPQGRNGGRNR